MRVISGPPEICVVILSTNKSKGFLPTDSNKAIKISLKHKLELDQRSASLFGASYQSNSHVKRTTVVLLYKCILTKNHV
jgi:hypothetical protein